MRKQILRGLMYFGILALTVAPRVSAHGEAADQPFLKDLTTAFYDVSISPTEVQVGQEVTMTGKVAVLTTWPYHLDPPNKAYFTTVVPGPVFMLKDRTVDGAEAPDSVFIHEGNTYEFKLVLVARIPGRYHMHPGLASEGTGTLVGPGSWITISPAASGAAFTFPLTLLNGTTIDLDTFNGSFIWWWQLAAFAIGVWWMLYWTLTHRTVTNLAVTIQLPLNDDAPDIGLITPKDHKYMNIMAALTIVLLIGGWTWMATTYPIRLPIQTVWFTPDPLPPDPVLATVKPLGASYSMIGRPNTLILKANVTNVASSPITVKDYVMAMCTFVNGGPEDQAKAGPSEFVGQMDVQPNTPIAPGETREVTMTISSRLFDDERIVPTRDPQQFIAGLIHFQKAGGGDQYALLHSEVTPTEYGTQFLP